MPIESLPETPDSPKSQAGSDALARYRAHGGGMELFRAYVERREADEDLNREKRSQLEAAFPKAGEGIPVEEFTRLTAELLRMSILDELDPIIRNLLQFCENQPSVDDQLVELRRALRIGKGTAPNESKAKERSWHIEKEWISAYVNMSETREFRSVDAIANEIANAMNISITTAKNYWNKKTRREPWVERWANEIIWMAKKPKKPKTISSRSQKISQPTKKRGAKPTSWK